MGRSVWAQEVQKACEEVGAADPVAAITVRALEVVADLETAVGGHQAGADGWNGPPGRVVRTKLWWMLERYRNAENRTGWGIVVPGWRNLGAVVVEGVVVPSTTPLQYAAVGLVNAQSLCDEWLERSDEAVELKVPKFVRSAHNKALHLFEQEGQMWERIVNGLSDSS